MIRALYLFSLVTLLLNPNWLSAQGSIKGTVRDAATNELLPFVNILLEGTDKGTTTDFEGNFELGNVEPGFVNLRVSVLGYQTEIVRDIQVRRQAAATVSISLQPSAITLEGADVRPDPFNRTDASPLSLRTIGIAEIERNPGGNRDISNVLRSFPGVGSTPAFRNDIIIRGGAPNENRFFLDGVEVPLINHFQTQGASGGPVGIINVNLIREVDFLSGAFPANRGNTLSSVLEFKQIDGNTERWQFRGTVGSSDAGVKADGPIGKNSSLIVSARASYLQFLFAGLGLPFLPTYYDYQFKYKIKTGKKSEFTLIGLGALDLFRLNEGANETETQRYQLRILPINEQWNYTIGGTYRRFTKNGFHLFVLSRNMLNNEVTKYADNVTSDTTLNLFYRSREIENRFRYEFQGQYKGWRFGYGVNAEYARFTNRTFNRIPTPNGIDTIDFNSSLNLFMGGAFGQLSRRFFDEKLSLSLGVRLDNTSYNASMANPFNQFSPRFSASWNFMKNFYANASVGRYYQRPAYTLMGFGDDMGGYANQDRLTYIRCDHLTAGLEWAPTINTKITVEGFYKLYGNYPFSLIDSISIANIGAGFDVVGNVPAASGTGGRARGFEVLMQQKLYKGFYGILAYTFVRSEFEDLEGNYIPSSWDSRHIITATAGYKIKRNWEFGLRWRFVDGIPFTPYDIALSSLIEIYDLRGQGIEDASRVNTERVPAFHQLDLRVDKVWFFKKWSLNLYLDIQNVYNFQSLGRPFFAVQEDASGNPVPDAANPGSYLPRFIPNTAGTVLPTLGIIVDF
jgi:hypothetical protein